MKTQFKRLLTLSLCLLCFGLSGYAQELTGSWRLKTSKIIKGPGYANAAPKQITINQTPDKIEFKTTSSLGDRDTIIDQTLTLKNIHENLTKTGKKRLISLQKKNDDSWIKQTEIFLKENPSQLQSTDEETYAIDKDGTTLNLYRNYDADEEHNTGNKDFTVEATYEKIDPEKLVRETATGKGVNFTEGLSWEQIKAKAKAENKYIFVDCYATWCGPCKQMDKEVYPLNTVGEAINEKFISVKVQMDSTKNDSENIKKTYSIARTFEKTYAIAGLPAYLFFSADGEIVHKAMGFQKAEDFIQLVKDVLVPEKQLYTQIKACRDGKMDVNLVPAFILRLNDSGDKTTALELARLYMKNHLEDLPEARFATKGNLSFFINYQKMLNSDDRIFVLSYKKPRMIDSVQNDPGLADNLITSILFNSVILPEFEIAKKNKREPDWDSLKDLIVTKGDKNFADKIIFDAKHSWYITIKDWDKACEYVIKKFEQKDLNKLPREEIAWELNHVAWTLFTYSFNKKQLEQGLIWVNEALAKDESIQKPNVLRMDTKANLLYKLGRKDEAIALQKKTVLLLESKMVSKNNETELHIALKKMKLGEPTWPTAEIGVDKKKQVK